MLDPQPLNDARLVHGLGKLVRPGQRVLRFNGDLLDPLLEKLHQQNARVRDISLDSFASRNDSGEGSALVHAIVQRRVEALIVTSEVQFVRLYQLAMRLDLARDMVQALRRDVVVATSEGCSAALEAHGLRPQLMPAQPQMLVMALMLFLEKGKGSDRFAESLSARLD